MRRLVDSTEVDEIAFDASAPEPGIPQLIDNPATGVPETQPIVKDAGTSGGTAPPAGPNSTTE